MSRPVRMLPIALLTCVGLLSGNALVAANLARGRTFTWSRSPNYRYCTDPADATQLTDGERATNDHIWIDRACVGWEQHRGDVITWRLDLGSPCRLDSIVVSTAWFERSEIVPPALVCALGSRADRFHWSGALEGTRLAPADSTHPERVRLVVPLHGAAGRWVLIAALLRSHFLCTDEIEVHGAVTDSAAAAAGPPDSGPLVSGPAAMSPGNPLGRAFTPDEIDAVCAVQRRAWAVRTSLGGRTGTSGDRVMAMDGPIPDDAWLAEARALGLRPSPLSRPAVDEEMALFAVRAGAWRAAGQPALTVRRVDPWAPRTPWTPLQPEVGDTLEVWPGAWGAAAFEIAVAAESTFRGALRISAAVAGAPRLVLREVAFVESRDGRWVADALPLAAESLAVAPGWIRQVWVDVDARDAVPGTFGLEIEAGAERVRLPVRVHHVPLAAPPLTALTWTYPSKFALTRRLPQIAVRDNEEHGIDSWILAEESIPWPDPASIDARGTLTAPLDFGACDRDLALLDATGVKRLLWYWDFDPHADDPSRGRFRHPYGSEPWRRAVASWLGAWFAHLDARGYDRSQIRMQPVDEAAGPRVEALYRRLRALHSGLQLALTVTRNATASQIRAMEPHLALAIVERRALEKNSSWIAQARRRGLEVWTYDVPAPSKAAAPVTRYRLLPWEAWARDLGGCGFWSYGDTGLRSADAWNDFDGRRWDFAVVYGEVGAPGTLGTERLAPSKRWQAFRMGLQDTSLLAAVLGLQPDLRATLLTALLEPAFDPDSFRRRLLHQLE